LIFAKSVTLAMICKANYTGFTALICNNRSRYCNRGSKTAIRSRSKSKRKPQIAASSYL